ncbi:hypothetical protein [Streptomyces aidingensis]|uniref:Uncharacterized protein n=1 Tax=Streptomyces aidingensis TaxID=910347 RepID=A0A1I1UBN7_9ACTN|nr:hypothetical protein [Streptomyces aidingensis]SFD66183.1 hypothetical protein SAMN05421773_1232 [Streptomyces aidingensis]
MSVPKEPGGFAGDAEDRDGAAWVPGVPYVRGWEDAESAGAALAAALRLAGVDGVSARPDADADGSGAVLPACPVSADEVLRAWALAAAPGRIG